MSKILIVDDDPHIRELVRVFLRNAVFDTEEAADGIAALERLKTIKADPSRNRELGGSRLGLSIASKIVGMHHGSIRVQSAPGVGTTFVVSLPMGRPTT